MLAERANARDQHLGDRKECLGLPSEVERLQ